ncbi:DUF2442 domain-containing protein [Thiomicrorhabdus sp. Milos-T2]|uniref:DUF2442 domain-containing protein n=1 Tax=Thiomicrorhabdus sp. Milos-T2 TaxID=90814 RepID=UPI000494A815|nr:DUF2442 domain-containing protein [Thiomicrorhabdus sp. Milos-T2]
MIPTELAITNVKHLSNYKLLISFSDGHQQLINFEHFLFNHQHPDIKKYQDINLFKNYSITDGDLEWNNYELCFPIADIYLNQHIEHKKTNVA